MFCQVILEGGGREGLDALKDACTSSHLMQIISCLARRLPQEQAEPHSGTRTLLRPRQAEEQPKRSCCSEKSQS